MKDKMRAKYHKRAMKMIHRLNKTIAEDNIWRGRFIAMNKEEKWNKFSDNSGGILYILVRMYDKKTKKYRDYRWDYMIRSSFNGWHLSMDIGNDFIVKQIKAWDEDPDPWEDTIDYNKIKINWDKINKAPYAWYPWEMGEIVE